MTPFASWPRWLQTLTLALVLAFTYLACCSAITDCP